MNQIISFLQGKRTYLISGCGLLVVAAWIFGLIDDQIAGKALTALGFGGVITLWHATQVQQAQTEELQQKVAALSRDNQYPVA